MSEGEAPRRMLQGTLPHAVLRHEDMTDHTAQPGKQCDQRLEIKFTSYFFSFILR
jgi:hypothetical protein